jgi:hypothetical protein
MMLCFAVARDEVGEFEFVRIICAEMDRKGVDLFRVPARGELGGRLSCTVCSSNARKRAAWSSSVSLADQLPSLGSQ